MGFLKDMENIVGRIQVFTKVILSKDFEMDMVFGNFRKKKIKNIEDIIVWTRKVDMESTNGKMVGVIREILITIIGMDLVNFTTRMQNLHIEAIGQMDSKLNEKYKPQIIPIKSETKMEILT